MNNIVTGKSVLDTILFIYLFDKVGVDDSKSLMSYTLTSREGIKGRKLHVFNYDFREFKEFSDYETIENKSHPNYDKNYCYGYGMYYYDNRS